MSSPITLLTSSLATFLNLYLLLLFVRILLTWFPTVGWMNSIVETLRPVTDPYLNVFRSIVPSVGGLDLSPILAFLVLQVLIALFQSVPSGVGGF
ncbi:MAG: YggT family protein [Coleofasciculaceae cyanobacterium SM2_1_6]|nr:YggT family protein [Coleofasciculaceae cyanobacterium SM2_1_6]